MAQNIIKTKIQEAYDSEANWKKHDPILLSGQVAFSSDKYGYFKVGNGSAKWSQLQYNSLKWDDISGKPSTFNPASHSHTWDQITNLAQASVKYAISAGNVPWSGVQDKPSSFTPSTHTHPVSQITGMPTKLPNPHALTFTGAANTKYDGTGEATVNIPTTSATPNSLTVQLNGGTTEGTNKFTFNGGTAKSVNITPASIGASPVSHVHSYAGSDSAGGSANSAKSIIDNGDKRSLTIAYSKPNSTNFGYFGVWEGNELRSTDVANVKNKLALNRVNNTSDDEKQIYEANLKWGGRNYSGDFGCIDAAMISELGANRFQFLNADGITIEYSRDNGFSWIDYGLSNEQKTDIFSTKRTKIIIGKATTSAEVKPEYKLRVSIDARKAKVYTVLNKFCIDISTEGSQGCNVTIERAKESSPTVFEKIATEVPILGWSGYNIINIPPTVTFGGSDTSQYSKLRFTFGIKSHSSNHPGLTIYNIKGFGGVGWNAPSNMAVDNHLYDFDANQNAYFPAAVKATRFDGYIKDKNSNRDLSISFDGSNIDNPSYFAVWTAGEIRTIATDKVKSAIGLGNVDNTADSAKSVKYATSAGSANSVPWTGVTGKPSTFTPESHTHAASQITGLPTSLKNPYALTLQLNGASQGAYDGSAAKTVNITPASIGAALSSHTHSQYAPTSHTHNGTYYPTPKTSITDFNKAITEGQYYAAGKLLNAPESSSTDRYGILNVYVSSGQSYNNSTNWIWQNYYDTTGTHFWRYKINATEWSAWRKVYNTISKPTPSEIGAAPASHTHDNYTPLGEFSALRLKVNEHDTELGSFANRINGKADKTHSHTSIKDFADSKDIEISSSTHVTPQEANDYDIVVANTAAHNNKLVVMSKISLASHLSSHIINNITLKAITNAQIDSLSSL